MKLTERYPLQVYYPRGGDHWILTWFTSWLQTSVIVAPSFNSMVKTWHSVLDKLQHSVKPTGYYVGKIVAPSEKMERLYARQEHATRLYNDVSNIGFRLRYQEERFGILPDGVSRCPNHDDDCIQMDWNKHRIRLKCLAGYIVNGVHPRIAAERMLLVEEPKSWGHTDRKADHKLQRSRAERIVDGTPYFMFIAQPGHHQDGTVVNETNGDPAAMKWSTPKLFILVGQKLDEIPPEVLQPWEAKKKKHEAEKEAAAIEFKEDRENYRKQETEYLQNLVRAARGR